MEAAIAVAIAEAVVTAQQVAIAEVVATQEVTAAAALVAAQARRAQELLQEALPRAEAGTRNNAVNPGNIFRAH